MEAALLGSERTQFLFYYLKGALYGFLVSNLCFSVIFVRNVFDSWTSRSFPINLIGNTLPYYIVCTPFSGLELKRSDKTRKRTTWRCQQVWNFL